MGKGPPKKIAIEHDDHHASHIGRTKDGKQFFMTTPFVPAQDHDAGREFVAVFLFDAKGKFLESRIDDLGPRHLLDANLAKQAFDRRLEELGEVEYGRIEIAPFRVEKFGVEFGLIPRPPEDDDEEEDGWWVELLPGNYMAFHEPWDSGEYDT